MPLRATLDDLGPRLGHPNTAERKLFRSFLISWQSEHGLILEGYVCGQARMPTWGRCISLPTRNASRSRDSIAHDLKPVVLDY